MAELWFIVNNIELTLRYFIQLSYQGTNYHGWQVQANAKTIQGILESSMIKILGGKISLVGAGRTDTGVHAHTYFAHFDYDKDLETNAEKFTFQLNGILPPDIAVKKIFKVNPDDHARFSALSRTYEYYISRMKNPFRREFEHLYLGKIDMESMNKACKVLYKHTDFTSFSKLHSQTGSNNCKIYEARWDELQYGAKLVFTIKADRFLRNMVRAIVGTLLQIGTGKIKAGSLDSIILQKDRSASGPSVPAKGLILKDIEYPAGLAGFSHGSSCFRHWDILKSQD